MKKTLQRTAAALLLVFMLPGASGVSGTSDVRAAMDVNWATVIIRSEPYDDEADLIRGADSVVYGWMDSADREIPTGQSVQSGKLVNFMQTFHVQQRLSGDARQLMRVAATGVEPLPDADNPINRLYPGPLVEGAYICFLKRIEGSDTYKLAGGWQGVYPVHEGKTISLQNEGFPQLGGLTVAQFEQRLRNVGH